MIQSNAIRLKNALRAAFVQTLAAGLWVSTPGVVTAQEPDSVAVALPAIVAVERQTQRTGSVPYSLASVPTADSLGRGLSLSEALGGVAGVEVQDRYNFAVGDRISIRGFGARTQFGVRGVRVMIDGVPATLADGQSTLDHLDPGAVKSVSVMRGPASAIYGNASGGVINFVTDGSPPSSTGGLGVRLGGEGQRRVEGRLAGTSGRNRFSVYASRQIYDGYRDHSSSDHNRVTLHARKTGSRLGADLSLFVVDFDALNPGSLSLLQLGADRTAANGFNVAQNARKSVTQAQIGARLRSLGAGVGFDVSAYGLTRSLDNPIPVRVIDLDRVASGVRGTLGGSTPTLSWLVGGSFDYQRDDRVNFDNQSGSRGPRELDQLEQVVNGAGFGQLSKSISSRFTATAALRYDVIRFEATDRLLTDGDDSGSRSMAAISPSLGFLFVPANSWDVFANLATAFETPTTTELANRVDGTGGFNSQLDPQRTIAVEAGVRKAGERYLFRLTGYLAVVEDELIPFESGSSGGTFFRNAGSSTHRGIEASGAIRSDALIVNGALTVQDVRFDSFVVGTSTFDGNRVPGTSPRRLRVGVSYDHRGWRLNGAIVANSSIPVDDANSTSSPAYELVDVRVGVPVPTVAGRGLSLSVGVNNLLDTDYNSSVAVNAFGSRFFEPGPPRTVFVTAGLEF